MRIITKDKVKKAKNKIIFHALWKLHRNNYWILLDGILYMPIQREKYNYDWFTSSNETVNNHHIFELLRIILSEKYSVNVRIKSSTHKNTQWKIYTLEREDHE